MNTILKDSEEESGYQAVYLLESAAEISSAVRHHDLEEASYHGDGSAYLNDEDSIVLYSNGSTGILKFAHEVDSQKVGDSDE